MSSTPTRTIPSIAEWPPPYRRIPAAKDCIAAVERQQQLQGGRDRTAAELQAAEAELASPPDEAELVRAEASARLRGEPVAPRRDMAALRARVAQLRHDVNVQAEMAALHLPEVQRTEQEAAEELAHHLDVQQWQFAKKAAGHAAEFVRAMRTLMSWRADRRQERLPIPAEAPPADVVALTGAKTPLLAWLRQLPQAILDDCVVEEVVKGKS